MFKSVYRLFSFLSDINQPALSLRYRQLFEFFISFPEKNLNTKFTRLQEKNLTLTGYGILQDDAKNILNGCYFKFKAKWILSNRIKDRFLSNNREWIKTKVQFKKNVKL